MTIDQSQHLVLDNFTGFIGNIVSVYFIFTTIIMVVNRIANVTESTDDFSSQDAIKIYA